MATAHSLAHPVRQRWTRAQYYQMAEQGWFQGKRVELIEGEVIRMPAQKNSHAIAIDLACKALEAAFGSGHWVRAQFPLHVLPRSAPEPDVAVVKGRTRDFKHRDHPTAALLVVEISDTTLAYDRGRKASLYAKAGIADYWIVNLLEQRVEVRRRPVPDKRQKYGYGYADMAAYGPGESLAPLSLPRKKIAVDDLLP
jgi:Uma2 family endonuclease